MEELFVQEPAIAAEKTKKEKSTPEVEKKQEVNVKKPLIHMMKQLKQALNTSKVMNLLQGYGQINMH